MYTLWCGPRDPCTERDSDQVRDVANGETRSWKVVFLGDVVRVLTSTDAQDVLLDHLLHPPSRESLPTGEAEMLMKVSAGGGSEALVVLVRLAGGVFPPDRFAAPATRIGLCPSHSGVGGVAENDFELARMLPVVLNLEELGVLLEEARETPDSNWTARTRRMATHRY